MEKKLISFISPPIDLSFFVYTVDCPMEGLGSFHIDILMLSCLFDNLKKNNKFNIFCGTWRPPLDLKF